MRMTIAIISIPVGMGSEAVFVYAYFMILSVSAAKVHKICFCAK